MDYEWDDEKCTRNIEKHHISFELIYEADWQKAFIQKDDRADYQEVRYIGYVPIKQRLHVVAYTIRGDHRRIISLRKANTREVIIYERTQIY